MGDKFIIDASCVLGWVEEKDPWQAEKALRIYEFLRTGEGLAYAPSFLFVEVANVLRWKKKISIDETREFIDRVKDSGINFIEGISGHGTIEEILEIMEKYATTSYDSQYVFLAQKMGLKLATFDEKLREIEEVVFDFDRIPN